MALFIPDGVYVIRNVETYEVVCLMNGIPRGPIVGCADGPGYPCERWNLWRIKNIGGGGVTIESVCVPGSFANANQLEGSPLFGAPLRTIWTVIKVDRGYYLQSPDANFVWQFNAEGAPIVLVHHTGRDTTKWEFKRI